MHCNRFNGPNSDYIHYDKNKHPVKAFQNFIGSDCDVALGGSNLCIFHNHCNIKGPAADCTNLVRAKIGGKLYFCSTTFHYHNEGPPVFVGR